MATTPEGAVKKLIKELLDLYAAYYHMPVQNGMGKPALDFHVCHLGRYAAVEAKAPGKKPTARQLETAAEVVAAGGRVFFIDGNVSELEYWLKGDWSEHEDYGRYRDLEYEEGCGDDQLRAGGL